MNKVRENDVPLMQIQPQHQSFTPSSNQTDSPRPSEVEFLHLPQGLITFWLKEEKKEGREGGKGERQRREDELVEVEWHPGKCPVGG